MTAPHAQEYYLNRELGLLAFNRRVLAQADDQRNPLLERLKFLCIVSSNLDEFFEVRTAGLKEQIALHATATGPDGMSARQVFKRVTEQAHELVEQQYLLLNEGILPELARHDIRFYPDPVKCKYAAS